MVESDGARDRGDGVNPNLAQKAARLAVISLGDGCYRVAGDSGTYTVSRPRFFGGSALTCDCHAAKSGSACSHVVAVLFHEQRQASPATA